MADIASLGIQVTTDGVQQAQSDLDKLAATGDKAATSTDKLRESSQKSAQTLRDTSALKAQQDALAKLIGQIDPTVAAFAKLDQQQAKLAAFRAAGAISADDFKAYSAAIDTARASVGSAAGAVEKFTLNNAAARRELGYLVKDMATGQWGRFDQSLATLVTRSGLLQVAFSATGVAIAGLVAEGLIFVTAANDAASAQNKFNQALAKTGDNAGVSTQGLSKLASQVAGASGNLTLANEVLTALAANGKVTSTSLLALGQAAYDMAQLTGENADKAAASVAQMFDGTAKSAEKANEQYHFLTLEIYDQIAALEKQGDTQKAVEVAATAFHDAISPRLDQMNSQVTGIAASWDKVKAAFSGFWEQFKTGASLISGTADLQSQIYSLQGQKDAAQNHDYSTVGKIRNMFFGSSLVDRFDSSFAQWSPDDERKLQDLQAQLSKKMQDADAAAQSQQVQDAGIAGQAALNGYLKKYESTEQQRQDQIVAIHNAANKAIAAALAKGDQALADQIMQQEATADAEARASWAKKGRKADPMAQLTGLTDKAITQDLMPNDASSAQNKLLDEQVKKLQAIADAGAKAIEKGASLAQVQGEVAKGVAATNDYYAKQANILQQKDIAAMAAYQAALDKQNDALQRNVDAQVMQVSLGDKEYQRQQQINQIYLQNADAVTKLQAQRSAPGADTNLIDQQISAQQANMAKQVAIVKSGYAQIDAAQGEWENGAKKAFANFIDQGQNVAGLTESFFTGAFNSMTNAISNFATAGKLNFKSLFSSILGDLAQMEARVAESQILSSILSAFGGGVSYGGGSGAATGTGSFSGFGSSGTLTTTVNAKGGVYDSPSLSAFSGQIVDKPTMFAFANGAGLMGEAGPEAILPLSRGADGRLGVRSGSSGGFNYSQSINIDNSGNASVGGTSTGSNADTARQLGEKMKEISRNAIVAEMRPGGLIWRMQNGS